MTLADKVCAAIAGASAVSLYAAYAVKPTGGRVHLPAAHIEHEKRNKDGRCIALRARYADGSAVAFTWSQEQGARYRAINPTR